MRTTTHPKRRLRRSSALARRTENIKVLEARPSGNGRYDCPTREYRNLTDKQVERKLKIAQTDVTNLKAKLGR